PSQDLHSFPTRRSSDLDDVRVLKQAVRGVVRAKRSAHRCNRNALRLAMVPDKRHDLFAQVRIKDRLDVAAVKRVRSLVVKTVPIDRKSTRLNSSHLVIS